MGALGLTGKKWNTGLSFLQGLLWGSHRVDHFPFSDLITGDAGIHLPSTPLCGSYTLMDACSQVREAKREGKLPRGKELGQLTSGN